VYSVTNNIDLLDLIYKNWGSLRPAGRMASRRGSCPAVAYSFTGVILALGRIPGASRVNSTVVMLPPILVVDACTAPQTAFHTIRLRIPIKSAHRCMFRTTAVFTVVGSGVHAGGGQSRAGRAISPLEGLTTVIARVVVEARLVSTTKIALRISYR
jgi:hypothetical protein